MTGRQPRTLRIRKREDEWGYLVELDGHDVSNALRGLTLEINAGDMPTATLRVVAEEVRAYLPDATKELLVRLGWTPPTEEGS